MRSCTLLLLTLVVLIVDSHVESVELERSESAFSSGTNDTRVPCVADAMQRLGNSTDTSSTASSNSLPGNGSSDDDERALQTPKLKQLAEKALAAKTAKEAAASAKWSKLSNLAKLIKASKLPKIKLPKTLTNAYIRFKMEIWYYHRTPPTDVWRMLGLRGTKVPREHPYFKYWYWYADAWRKSQPVSPS